MIAFLYVLLGISWNVRFCNAPKAPFTQGGLCLRSLRIFLYYVVIYFSTDDDKNAQGQ